MRYNVTWHTVKGPLDVVVDATCVADPALPDVGSVVIDAVFKGGKKLDPEKFMAAERMDLYQRIRDASGLCPHCSGKRELIAIGIRDGKDFEETQPCALCRGSGKLEAPLKTVGVRYIRGRPKKKPGEKFQKLVIYVPKKTKKALEALQKQGSFSSLSSYCVSVLSKEVNP